MSNKKKQEPMTQFEYIECGAAQCPFCRSDNISGGTFESSNTEGTHEIKCNGCGRKWFDVYELTSYEPIVD